ncbi:MAG: ABC transporter substrate-binding protein [Clostridium sp.]
MKKERGNLRSRKSNKKGFKILFRNFSLFVCMILIISAFSGCGNSNKSNNEASVGNENSIKIGYLPITHAIPLYVEKEKENSRIELVKFGSWPELMEALNSGKIDGASVLIELAMKAKSQGIDLKAVALGHTDGNAVIVSNDINSVSDLKGKNFAIPNKLSTHNILLYQLLKSENMNYNDVNIVELSPAEMPVALQEKRIDGYCVAEPFGAKSVAVNNGKVLKQSGEIIPNSICCSLVLRGEFIENNREKAKEIVRDYKKASEYTSANEEDTKKLSKSFLNVSGDALDLSLGWIKFDKLKIDKEDYNTLNNYLLEMNLLDNEISYEDFVDNSLLEEVE